MDQQRQQIIDKLKAANNILVTVSTNPSVDQLAACIGLTLMLNKMDKHATAVFSGEVPSTIDFLKPEETLEKTTDSLRDFIIALDKSKADKLRYKVEENIVKIFITPYRTSLSEKDLEFSQGDFNVDVVVALGVHEQQELDSAITAHGRILHDATVVSISDQPDGNLGTINWFEGGASSLSELIAGLAGDLGQNLLDGQTATALLTGIVAETERFSNQKTSPQTMSISSALLAAGANQQLVATELQAGQNDDASDDKPEDQPSPEAGDAPYSPKPDDGTLEIDHEHAEEEVTEEPQDNTTPPDEAAMSAAADITPGEESQTPEENETPEEPAEQSADKASGEAKASDEAQAATEEPGLPRLIMQPPALGGTLTANSRPEELSPTTDPFSMPETDTPMLNRSSSLGSSVQPPTNDPVLPSDAVEPSATIESSNATSGGEASTPDEPAPEPQTESRVPATEDTPQSPQISPIPVAPL